MAVLPLDPARRAAAAPAAPSRPSRVMPPAHPAPAHPGTERPTGGRPPVDRPLGDRPVPRAVVVEPGTRGSGVLARLTPRHGIAVAAARHARATPAAARRAEEWALMRRFLPIALVALLADLATKAMVEAWLPLGTTVGGSRVALHLVHNALSAGNVSLGPHTWTLNFTTTGILAGLLVLLVPTLARIDRRAVAGCALLVGGALGNLWSMATSPRGVPDFLAVRHADGAIVFNVADVAILLGLLVLARTVWCIARAVVREGARRPVASLARPA
jgi:lipoprotein signal peptidase